MDKQQEQGARQVMVELMQAGYNWRKAAEQAGLEVSESTAYYWLRKYRKQGEEGLIDERHGHRGKVSLSVLQWMEALCKSDPYISSSAIQKQLKEQMKSSLSLTHLNRMRAAHGWTRQRKKKTPA
jgi:transposase